MEQSLNHESLIDTPYRDRPSEKKRNYLTVDETSKRAAGARKNGERGVEIRSHLVSERAASPCFRGHARVRVKRQEGAGGCVVGRTHTRANTDDHSRH